MRRLARYPLLALLGLGMLWACPFDMTLREYLSAQFWMPFAHGAGDLAREGVQRLSAPFAGMQRAEGGAPLMKLRAAYQTGAPEIRRTLAGARSAPGLSQREREEVDLLEAKIYMREGSREEPTPLIEARARLQRFLTTARTPEFLSEARGWVAYTHYLLGEQSAAGKIYLDELNRSDSNLSRETLVNSLRMTYGYDGGPTLRAQLGDYFDTPEHAAFAIRLVTNPRWDRHYYQTDEERLRDVDPVPYARIQELLAKNAALLQSERGANALAILAMRTALRAGDPRVAIGLAANVPSRAAIRAEPEFLWLLASARFLTRNYAGAEMPLLQLYQSGRSSDTQKAAAAYGLCGVYAKRGNPVEQIRFALELNWMIEKAGQVDDLSVYWAASGWDLSLVLDAEAPIEALREFIAKYPRARDVRLVQYSLAVRLARAGRYEDAADLFASINARLRARRMREIAALSGETPDAKFALAKYLSENSDRIYFNDWLWGGYGYQRYALSAEREYRFTRAERQTQMAVERRLKDEQEELWRAHLILRDVVTEAGPTELGTRSAALAIRCVRRLSERFGRTEDIRAADIELTRWLRGAERR